MNLRGLALSGALVFIVTPVTGCIFVPVIEGVNQMGLTKEDRASLLPGEVKRFQDARYWGNYLNALSYVLDESKDSIGKQLRRRPEGEKIVKSELREIELSPDGHEADVEVLMKRYDQNTLVVRNIEEVQHWRFLMGKGWRLLSMNE